MSTRPDNDPRNSPVMIRGDLVRNGWTDKAIARQVRAGSWVRLRRGAYLEKRAWRGLDRAGRHEMLARAVVAQAKTEVVISHLSAIPFYDLSTWDIKFDAVDVTRLDRAAGRREAGVRQHRGVVLEGDVVDRHGLQVVSATRLALEVTTCVNAEHALVIIDQLLNRGLTTEEQLLERHEAMEHWPATLLTKPIISRADGRHESVGESRTASLFHDERLPAPEPQYTVRDAAGTVAARLDFALPAYRAYVEFDGRQKYAELVDPGRTAADVIMAEKQREKRVFDQLGWLCIRITWDDLQSPAKTAARIRSMLKGRLAA